MGGLLETRTLKVLRLTFEEWQRDECLEMGTSLAYYALFSIFPLLLLILSIFGFIVGPDSNIRVQLLQMAAQSLPQTAYTIVESTLSQLNANSGGASIVGLATLLLSASGVFGALDRAFDKIWNVRQEQQPNATLLTKVLTIVWQKVVSFLLVLGCALLVLISMLSNLAVGILIEVARNLSGVLGGLQLDEAWLWQILQLGISFLLLALVLMLLFKFLPSTRVAWGDVWLGALITAVLFIVLQRLVVGSVVNLGSNYQSYGVVGGVMLLMFWIYLTSQVLFIGAEFTYAYAQVFGSRRQTASPSK